MKKRLIKYISLFIVAFSCVLTIGLCCIKKTSALEELPFDTTNAIGYNEDFSYQNIEGLTLKENTNSSNYVMDYLELDSGYYCNVTRNAGSMTSFFFPSFVLPRKKTNDLYCLVIYVTNYILPTNYSRFDMKCRYYPLATDGYTTIDIMNYRYSNFEYTIRDTPLFCYFNYYNLAQLDSINFVNRSITLLANYFDYLELNVYLYKVGSKVDENAPIIDSVGNLVYNNKVYYNTDNYIQYGNDKYNEGLETRQDINIKDYLLNSTFSTTFYSSNVHSPDNVIGYSITTITESDFINDKLQIYDIWVRNAIDSFGSNWLDTGQYYYYDNEILFDKVLDNNAISVVFVGNSSVYDNEPYIKYTDNTIKVLTTDNLNSIYVFFTENENLKYINTLGWSGYGEDYTGQYIYISIGGELYGLGYNEGLIEGNISGYNNGYGDGYEIGYNNGANDGYENGINASAGNTWSSIWDFIYNIFVFIGRFMDIEILPNIKIGYIVGIAIVFALFGFIINISK